MVDAVTSPTNPLQLTVHPLPDQTRSFWSGDTPSFKDVLDTINPLQHIPVISSLYQSLTGDVPSTGSSLAGGALFGGPIGLVASIFDTIVKNETGAGITGNILAAIEGKPVPALQPGNTPVQTASAPDSANASARTNYNAYVQTSKLA